MNGQPRRDAPSVRRILLFIILGSLLAGSLAGIFFQPGSAAQDTSPRLNPKQSVSTTTISEHQPWQGDLTDVMHPLTNETNEQLHAETDVGGYVIEEEDGQSHCRTATEAEARAMRERDTEQQLHAITHEDAAAQTGAETHAQTGDGLKIILRTTPQLEQFPVAKAAFIRAAQHWESVIQTPVTLVIDVDYGPTWFGVPYATGILGQTDEQYVAGSSLYPAVRAALIARSSNAQESALYNLLPQSQVPTDIGATTAMSGAAATFRALGILQPVADPNGELANLGTPPAIGFNSAHPFDFDLSDGIASGKYDFDTTATHEIGHALGFISEVGERERAPGNPLRVTPEDLFRFRPGITTATFSTMQRVLSSGGEHVFFGGGSEIRLSTGRSDHVGGDSQQASHWKDLALNGGRYIGIMHPRLPDGTHWEISENDLKALDLMGYRVNSTPGPTPTPTPSSGQTVELKADDGVADTGVYSDGLMMVTRLTPPSYPATLRTLRFLFAPFQGQPDPTGKPVTLVLFSDPGGTGQPPAGAQVTRLTTTVPGASASQFFDLDLPNGPTINSGDFYVGFQASTPHQGVGFALDTSGQSLNRTFYSTSNGASFSPLAPALQVPSVNAMIRAVVAVRGGGPTPTPTPSGDNSLPLTSGVPQTFAIPAPPPNGALLAPQFRIQVPAGGAQLKIDLSGNQDVDLYARFGRPIEIQNNAPVTDFKSDSPTGNETIIITPGSSPPLQAGTYFIAVGNYGPGEARVTLTATLSGGPTPTPTPNPTPTPPAGNRLVRMGQAGGSPGGMVGVPIELVAQGDENALGFSLTFDPAVLSNPQANLGSDAAGATLNANNGQLGSGRLGIALSLPFGQKFTAGTRQIVVVNFAIANSASASSTQVGFGDQPIAREISDVNAAALQANYTPGTVSITSGFEADVAPRPNGNGSVTITDWVQIGRFVAGQDAPSASEFQRADTAPRETRGNGSLSITDWVQAGRFAAGLDAPIPAGGPNNPGGGFAPTATLRRAQFDAASGVRQIRISSGQFEPGRQSSVIIELDAEGNENALGFSLTFNPAQLRFVTASLGKDAIGATLNINTSMMAKGSIGAAVALPAGQTLPAGRRKLILINFAIETEFQAATISFGDQPVSRELSDANANSLPVNFINGTLTLARSVASVSAASFTGQSLASEAIVAAFGQNLATQLAVADTLPLPTSLAGTTVKVRDSANQERMAPLFFVAPMQINYQIPADTAAGEATVTITSGDGWVSTGMVNIAAVAPGLFSAESSGQGVAAAVVLRIKANGAQSYEPVAQFDAALGRFVAVPIDLGEAGDQVFLLLYGSGFRHHSNLGGVTVTLDEVEAAALFAGGLREYAGLDQLNLRIPRSLIGRGEVDVKLNVDGHESNRVKIHVK